MITARIDSQGSAIYNCDTMTEVNRVARALGLTVHGGGESYTVVTYDHGHAAPSRVRAVAWHWHEGRITLPLNSRTAH